MTTRSRRSLSRALALRALPVAAFAALLAGGLPARAQQDSVDPVDPIEDQALAEEAAAEFDKALDTMKRAFDTCVREAAAGGAVRKRNLARAEVLLEKVDSLTETVTAQKETDRYLEAQDGEALGPLLAGHVAWRRAGYRLAEGDLEGAAALAAQLGFVRSFWVVGPFDNERGRGFGVARGPEKGIDLAAEFDGKERKVAWRHVPVAAPLAYVDLDAMLRPNDQAAAYAVAFVRADAAGPAALRIGSDEAVKAWWNGAEVLSRDVRRPLGFDQDVVTVSLAEGWNVLLLKVCDQTGAWGFRARLTALDGGPLAGLRAATTPEEAAEAVAAKPQAAPLERVEADAGAKSFYEGATANGASARDLFHLGLLHHRREFDTISDRRAETLLKQAAELDPENAIFRFHYAEAAAPPIEMAVEKEENRQRIAREKTLELQPGYAVAYRALASYYATSLVNLDQAERLLRKALELNPDFVEARLDLASVLGRRGLPVDAQRERERALATASAQGREIVASAAAAELERQGRGREALDAWKSVLTLDARENGIRRRVAELALRALDRDDALKLLEEIRRVDPWDTQSLARLAQLHEGRGDWDAAAATLREALAIAPEDDDLLAALGRVQSKGGHADEALAAYREALRVNPKRQDLERYVEYLDPSATPYENAYETDITPLIAKAADYDNSENDGWLVLLDQVVDKVNPDGTSSTYVHMAAKILTDAGVRRFDRYFAQSWSGESFKWKAARVVKPDGSVVDAKTQSNRGMRFADFPPLTPGDVIEVAYRRDDREQSFFGDYFGNVNYFADQVPMLVSTYTLITPAARKFYFHEKNLAVKPTERLSDDGTERIYTWTVNDAPKVKDEIAMPSPREVYPQVQVTTYESWDAFAKWWWSMIRDQHIASDELKAKVAELVAGKETRLDRIRAIYEFVTGEVTYQAWEFGVHGYKPYTTTAIFEKREGDCKDKAILFNTMLNEIGVEAHPVLVMGEEPRSEEDMSLAMVNHFNHCISYVPDIDGNGTPAFLDGTAEYASLDLPPSMDRGAKVLVVRPEGAQITTIPLGTADDQGLDQKWDVEVRADGSARVKGEFVWRGDLSIQARRMFSVEGQRPLILQGLLAQVFGSAKLVANDFDDLRDLRGARESFRIECEVPKFVKEEGGERVLPTGFLQVFGQLSQIVQRPSREHDMVLQNPMSFTVDATYRLPEGWTVSARPEDVDLTISEASFVSNAKDEGGVLTLHRKLSLDDPRIKVADYAAFREGVVKATSLAQQTWKVKPGDAPAATDGATGPDAGEDQGK